MPMLRMLVTSGLCLLGTTLFAADAAPKAELLAPPKPDAVQSRLENWLVSRNVTDETVRSQIKERWNFGEETPSAQVVFERLIESFALADADTRTLLAGLALPDAPLSAPEATLLEADGLDPFYATNLRVYFGRYLAHRRMYDEALLVFAPVNVHDAVDPATYLFFKASCEKALLHREDGLKTLDQLLKNTEGVPVRYSTVATLMQHDLEAIKDKSLDEVSWKMDDVERRLRLARAGEKTQKVEGEIIALLDEIIKKIEEQQGGGGGGGGSGNGKSNSNQSSSPAGDSTIKGATAPGEVDKKNSKGIGNWGNLDEKTRAKVKNLISRDFPAHYRKAVEEYFRKLAERETDAK